MLQDCEFVDTDKLIVTNVLRQVIYGSNHIFLPRAFSRCSQLWLLHPIKRCKQTNAAFSKKFVPKKVLMPAMSRLASVTSFFNNVRCSKFFFPLHCKLKEKYPIIRKINSKKNVNMWNQHYYFWDSPKLSLVWLAQQKIKLQWTSWKTICTKCCRTIFPNFRNSIFFFKQKTLAASAKFWTSFV